MNNIETASKPLAYTLDCLESISLPPFPKSKQLVTILK